MTVALAVITDGRDTVHKTIASASVNLIGPITLGIIYDDTGDLEHARSLARFYPHFTVIGGDQRRGFGGAIAYTWQYLYGLSLLGDPGRFLFWLEDDFEFNRPVNLLHLARVLDAHPHLVQLALRRQPWNDEERAAGGIVEQHPDDYTDHEWQGLCWLEHRRFFTTNPSLYRRSLCALGWPDVPHSEGVFTHQLLADPLAKFGFWGARDSGEAVTHIGRERVGSGY